MDATAADGAATGAAGHCAGAAPQANTLQPQQSRKQAGKPASRRRRSRRCLRRHHHRRLCRPRRRCRRRLGLILSAAAAVGNPGAACAAAAAVDDDDAAEQLVRPMPPPKPLLRPCTSADCARSWRPRAATCARTKSPLPAQTHAPSRLARLATQRAPGLRRRLNVTLASPPISPSPTITTFQLTLLPLPVPRSLLLAARPTTDCDTIGSSSIALPRYWYW